MVATESLWGRMVGKSTAVNQLRQVIERVAPANSRIMITGQPGAGKHYEGVNQLRP